MSGRPLNRAARRAGWRDTVRRMRRAGCTCRPERWDADANLLAARNAVDGWLIEHQPGCPFGAAMTPFNKVGLIPEWYGRGVTRCER